MKACFRLIALLAVLAAGPARADAEAALRRFVEDVTTLQARYEQVQTDEDGALLQRASGEMALQRPGRFRWTYDTPYEQLMVCDGDTIWVYDPDLAQVTKRPAQAALAGTPAALLSQRDALGDNFTIEDAGEVDGLQHVRLLPKSAGGDFRSIELWLMNGAPLRMRFHDTLGGQTEIEFHRIALNPELDSSLFRFVPPPGVEVVDAG